MYQSTNIKATEEKKDKHKGEGGCGFFTLKDSCVRTDIHKGEIC